MDRGLKDLTEQHRGRLGYGMIEQVGRVYSVCAAADFHAPDRAEVIMRNPITWQLVASGRSGTIEVMSLMSHSYPGHTLLTQDLGVVQGIGVRPQP